jgi:preprotein translocase subunit SecD
MRLVLDAAAPDSEEMVQVTRSNNPADWPTLHVQTKVLLDETCVKSAGVRQEAGGPLSIMIEFTEDGAKRFAELTLQCKDKRLAIIIDGTLWSVPRIMERITGGQAAITGAFSREEAIRLAEKIQGAVKKG